MVRNAFLPRCVAKAKTKGKAKVGSATRESRSKSKAKGEAKAKSKAKSYEKAKQNKPHVSHETTKEQITDTHDERKRIAKQR